MEEIVQSCYKLIQSKEKITIKELESLLKKENTSDRKRFIDGFLPRLFNMVYNLYNTYHIMFNDCYNFEDLFYDAIEVLIRDYDNWKYIDNRENYENLSAFTDEIRYHLLNVLTNSYRFHMTYPTWKKINDLMVTMKKYQEDNGEEINLEELVDSNGLDIDNYCRAIDVKNYDDLHIRYDIIDSYIEKENDKDALRDIKKLIEDIPSERTKKIIYEYFGLYYFDRKSIQEIGNELGLTRQMVNYLKKPWIDIIKNNKELKKKYTLK